MPRASRIICALSKSTQRSHADARPDGARPMVLLLKSACVEIWSGLWPFLSSYLMLLVMPGPNAAVVIQASLHGSRRTSLLAACGIASGAGLLAALASGGVFALAPQDGGGGEAMRGAANAVFVLVLLICGWKAVRRSLKASPCNRSQAALPGTRQFVAGFLTAAANPITATFFAAFIAGAGAQGAGVHPVFLTPLVFAPVVFLLVAGWFVGLGTLLRRAPVRRLFHRCWRAVDGLAGAVLILAACLNASAMLAASA